MEHNKNVLTSQEQAMKEYLKRQQKEAEKHIKQYSPAMARKHSLLMGNPSVRNLPQHYGAMSMPGTPVGLRRQNFHNKESTPLKGRKDHPNGDIYSPYNERSNKFIRGGSLERNTRTSVMNMKEWQMNAMNENFSDSEYMKNTHGHPANVGHRSPKERRNNSKSLPKGTSALNYGLLLGQIQQKRHIRQNKSIDGSVSDSNYSTYSEIHGKNNYQWMHPSSTGQGPNY